MFQIQIFYYPTFKNLCNYRRIFKSAQNYKMMTRTKTQLTALQILSFISFLKQYSPFYEKVDKSNRYWLRQSVPEILEDADNLYLKEEYVQVYELLNRAKFNNNVEIQWRICRVLFKMSCQENLSKQVRSGMIEEAFNLISMVMDKG